MSEQSGTVAHAIRGFAQDAFDKAAQKGNLPPVVAVRLLQKAWTDSHLFGLLVMSMYFLVALSVLVAFGASHDKDIDWALKEYLDNFADACSIATIGLSFYGASLVQFNFRVRHFQGQFAAEFRANPGFSSNILFEFLLKVILSGSAIVLAIAYLTYYFGSGRNFREYVQMYTDEVADVCSIICFTDYIAFSLAFQATNSSCAIIITDAEKKIVERNRRKKFNNIYLQRLLQIGFGWLFAIVAVSQYMATKQQLQGLSFFAVAKEYLDEAADVASICMFALFVSSVFSARALVSRLFNSIYPNGDHAKVTQIDPQHMSAVVVVSTIAAAFGVFKMAQDPLPVAANVVYKHVAFFEPFLYHALPPI